jgi:peptidoglycan/LPS O-acetylase OafA/YrhL
MKHGRLAYIDSMRGIAALLVVWMHMFQPVATGALRDMLYYVLDPGKVGVIVFFAISGFVIPYSFPRGPAPIARFTVSRILRLYPAYWLSMVAWIALMAIAGEALPSTATILANVTMAQTALGQPNIIGIYWTLFIELLFYVSCAVAFALGLLYSARFVFAASAGFLLIAVLLAAARFYLERKVPVAVPLSLSIMFWGTLWREATLNRSAQHRRYAWWMLGAYAVAMPPISLLAYDMDLGLEEYWVRYMVSYYVALALFMLLSTRLRLEGRTAVWLGRISYSLYLFHNHAKKAVDLAADAFAPGLSAAVRIALAVALALAAAEAIFHLVEKPAIELGKRISRTIADRVPTAAAPAPLDH